MAFCSEGRIYRRFDKVSFRNVSDDLIEKKSTVDRRHKAKLIAALSCHFSTRVPDLSI
jgi:hypothetical protein